jgi:hypothetical protein
MTQQLLGDFGYDISTRTRNCLLAEKIYTKEQVIDIWNKEPRAFLRFENLGRRSFNEIKDWMAQIKLETEEKPEVKPEVKPEDKPEEKPTKRTIATEILEGVVHTLKEARKNSSNIRKMDNELARGFDSVGQNIQSLTARIIRLETAIERLTPSPAKGLAPLDDFFIAAMAENTPLTPAAFKEFTRMVEKAHGIR